MTDNDKELEAGIKRACECDCAPPSTGWTVNPFPIIRDYIERLKHRAEVAEQALNDITNVLPCSVCPYDDYDGVSHQCDLDTMTCLENCLSIAERRLAQKAEGKS